jgi:glyoxylase-like metal-dependent hydrolase (beta-lactamase superfamily II)
VEAAIGLLSSAGSGREQTLEYLRWATARSFGADPRAWSRWWDSARTDFEVVGMIPPELPPPGKVGPAGGGAGGARTSPEEARGSQAAEERAALGRTALWRLTPLLTGRCYLGEDHVLGEGTAEARIPFAIYSFLVEGPGGRFVLVDLGPKTIGAANEMFRRHGLFRRAEGQNAGPDDIVQERGNVLVQLEGLRIRPDDIGHIIFSHLHADHHGFDTGKEAGAAADFPRAILHVSRAGWVDNLVHRRPDGGWGSYVDFSFSDFLLDAGAKGRCRFEDDAQVLPGIRTIHLGGHSPCSQAVLVDTPEGRVLLTSDEVYRYDLLERGLMARLHTSPERLVAATDLLVELATRENAILVPSHDPAVA